MLFTAVPESAPCVCVWTTPLTPTEKFPSAGAPPAPPAESYFVHDQISAAVSNPGVRAAGGCWHGLNHRFNQWLLTLLSRLITAGHARGLHARIDLLSRMAIYVGSLLHPWGEFHPPFPIHAADPSSARSTHYNLHSLWMLDGMNLRWSWIGPDICCWHSSKVLEIEVNELQLIAAFIPDYSRALEDPRGGGCIDKESIVFNQRFALKLYCYTWFVLYTAWGPLFQTKGINELNNMASKHQWGVCCDSGTCLMVKCVIVTPLS